MPPTMVSAASGATVQPGTSSWMLPSMISANMRMAAFRRAMARGPAAGTSIMHIRVRNGSRMAGPPRRGPAIFPRAGLVWLADPGQVWHERAFWKVALGLAQARQRPPSGCPGRYGRATDPDRRRHARDE